MSLPAGARLGPYEILAPLGAGGMGVVYKARDTRLDRLVAVKVLAAHLSASPQARQRFEREAKLVSQLSHPHICALFDVGHEGGTDFLVMELLEGQALSDRLGRGPLPFAEMLRHGIEIADALDKAHAAGIVHRDLKPANVMLTKSGVKLLDFGLARALESAAPAEVSGAATMSAEPLTQEGAVIGTLQYMAPEQVEGKAADARSDIFALGAVLYEMAAGRRPFSGESRAAIASAILSAEPEPLSSIKPQMPPAFTRLVRTCLEKDPERRWQSVHDVALQLRALADPEPVSGVVTTRRATPWLPWTIAALATLAAVGALLRPRPTPAGAPAATIRFRLPPPTGRTFLKTVEVVPYALSPDGTLLIVAARDTDGTTRLWLRPLSSADARPIEGTEGALTAIWSPDSRSIAFAAGGKLKRLDLSGGPALSLCEVRRDIGVMGSWGSAGQILFASIEGEGIWSVPSAGGTPVVLVKGDPAKGDVRVNWPSFLPDGKRFLYLARDGGDTGHIALGEAGQPSRFVRAGFSPAYYAPPGQILFVQDGTLLGQRFDAERGVVLGEPFPVAEPVNAFTSAGWAGFTVSQNGVLAYASGRDRARLAWIDRSGRELATVGSPADIHRVVLSRDGRQALFDRASPGSGTFDLWTVDIARNTESRLTSDPGSEISGAWLPDASAVLFSASRRGPPHLFRKDLASGAEEELTPPGRLQFVLDSSPDGRVVLYQQRSSRGDMDIMTLSLAGPHTPTPVLESAFAEVDASFSPDGRAIAYSSNESGAFEVYVRSFPEGGPRTRASTGGGETPRWSRDSHELFYVDTTKHLVAVTVKTAPVLEVGRPVTLFPLKDRGWLSYAPAPDGTKFLAIVSESAEVEQPLTVVLNWPAEARKADAP